MSHREAARALMMLRRTQRRTWARRRRRLRPHRGGAPGTVDRRTGCRTTVDRSTIESIRRRLLDDRNWVSVERIEAAHARLEAGEEPSADVVAEMMVRRTICDRLS
ncbi:MAG: hypothetical protein ACRD07_21535 [Acidimicrobiales bacterium]